MIGFNQVLLMMLLIGIPAMGGANVNGPPAGRFLSLFVPQADVRPVIDGFLTEDEWRPAAIATRFWMPLEQRWPSEQTEVLVLADSEFLYIAFRCYDSKPELIEASQLRRDKGLGFDDQVIVELDPFHNHREVSKFLVNAKGTQEDFAGGGRADKIGWKGDWYAASRVTSFGWTAEIAIPFGILNYDEGHTFGVNFKRYHYRTREWSVWADTGLHQREEEMAHLTAMKLPEKTNGNPWTYMPYLLIGRNIPDKEGDVRDHYGTAGLDIRYQPKPHVTGVLSLNPDFSQLESQVTDIDFSDNEKLVNDPRPFYQEGANYFGAGKDLLYFYSVRVPDFNVGAKYFAQQGAWQSGLLMAQAPDDRWDSVARATYAFDTTHNMTGMLVATDRKDLSNQLVMGRFDGRRSSGLNYRFETAFSNTDSTRISSTTVDSSEIDLGSASQFDLGWDGNFWWVSSSIDYFGREFFPANGIQNSDEVGTRGLGFSSGYYRTYLESVLREVNFSIAWDGRDTVSGTTQRRIWSLGGSIETAHQIRSGLYYYYGEYRPLSDFGRGEFSDDIRDDRFWTGTLDFNTRSNRLNYGVSYSDGYLGGDDYRYVIGYAKISPTLSTSLKVTTERLENFGAFEQSTFQGTWDFTRNDGVSFRYIDSDDGSYKRLAYRRTVRKGMDIFAVYNKDLAAKEEFSIKLLSTFR